MSRLRRGLVATALAAWITTAPAMADVGGHAGAGAAFGLVSQAEIAALVARAAEAPHSADAQFEVAMAFARTPFPERAWEALERVNALDPDYASRVMERYGASVEADPNDLEARFRLAVGFYFRGRREAARQQLQAIVARAPRNPWALTYLGWLQTEQGHLDQAVGLWQRAISVDPNHAMAHWLIGQAHFRKGRSGPAAAALKTAATLRSAHPLAGK